MGIPWGLVERLLCPTPRISDSVGLGGGVREELEKLHC